VLSRAKKNEAKKLCLLFLVGVLIIMIGLREGVWATDKNQSLPATFFSFDQDERNLTFYYGGGMRGPDSLYRELNK